MLVYLIRTTTHQYKVKFSPQRPTTCPLNKKWLTFKVITKSFLLISFRSNQNCGKSKAPAVNDSLKGAQELAKFKGSSYHKDWQEAKNKQKDNNKIIEDKLF
jgi:hypothetical protein